MIRAVLLLAFVGSCLASGHYGGYHDKTYCYQCQFVPPKTVTKTVYETEEYEVKIPTTSVHCWYKFSFRGEASEIAAQPQNDCKQNTPDCKHETTYQTIKKTRQVPRTVTNVIPSGGFPACEGPITPESAKRDGVDDWECHANCYTRLDSAGRITRGCYKDQLGVDPNRLGCSNQGGYTYCFCKGNHCNSQTPRHL